jgi:hypothetical protein
MAAAVIISKSNVELHCEDVLAAWRCTAAPVDIPHKLSAAGDVESAAQKHRDETCVL